MKSNAYWGLVAISLSFLLVAGCSNSTSPSGTGELKLLLTDSPAQYDEVNIVVTQVDVHVANADSLSGWSVVNNDSATYDLLTLRNGANAILGDTMLAVGHYTQIRLHIGTGSNVVVGGVRFPLDVSSDSIVKLNHEFDISSGTLYLLTLDFNADRSIVLTGSNHYKLDPVIRVEANVVSGTISGIVNPISARAMVSTVAGSDTVSTACDTVSGAFVLVALPEGMYDVNIAPSDTAYLDTTLTGIQVTAQHNTNVGIMVLRHR